MQLIKDGFKKKERKKERKMNLILLTSTWSWVAATASAIVRGQIRVTVNTSANQDSMKVDDPNPFTETQIR